MSKCSCPNCCSLARFDSSVRDATVRSNLSALDILIARNSCCESKTIITQPAYDTRYDLDLLRLGLLDRKKSNKSCYCLAKRRKQY